MSLRALSPRALSQLDRSLLRWLTFALGPTLALEFKLFRYASQSAVERIVGASADGPRARYTVFVRGLLEGGLSGLFREYAVLARIVATLVEFHVAATEELVSRVVTDQRLLARSLFGREPGRVETADTDLSDRHFGGRCVVTLHFASGDKVVYKPRSLAMEAAWSQLIGWLGQRGLALEPLRVLDRGAYGWMEHVTSSPCPGQSAAGRYFRRTGQLLAVLHALRATDCHLENLIACGEQPHLIDSETLFHPPATVDDVSAMAEAATRLAASVLRIGLLPQWEPGPDGLAFDASALGGRGDEETPCQVPEWENVNTDAMTRRFRNGRTRRSDNLLRVGDLTAEPAEFAAEIVAGFHVAARFLHEHRGALTAPDGPLAAFAGLPARFIVRPTSRYEHLLHTVLAPESLRDGASLDIALDVLAADLMAPAAQRLWPLLDAEKDALARLDVPHFAIRCDGDAVEVAPGRSIARWAEQTGLSRAVGLLRQPADGEAWAGQAATIRAAIYAGALPAEIEAANAWRGAPEPPGERPPLPAEDATLHAVELARMLASWAIRAADGETAWIGLVRDPRTARLALRPLGFGLYDGAPGIALFLAAVHAAAGAEEFRDLALGALAPLRRALADRCACRDIASELGMGGAQGLGSAVYALTSCAWLLGEPSLLADAKLAARLISQERIDADRELVFHN